MLTDNWKESPSEKGPVRGDGFVEKIALGRPVQVIKTSVILPTDPIPPNVSEL